MPRRPPFSPDALREAVASSICCADALRALGLRAAGHNFRTIKKYVALWEIDTSHFDPNKARALANRNRAKPLAEVLVEGSTYSRGHLKERLYAAGLKSRTCELCGQGEVWKGKEISLVLDHINGRADDNRLENLQIVCPNCAATLDTHCGRNLPRKRECTVCGHNFRPRTAAQRLCSKRCMARCETRRLALSKPRPDERKVDRPAYDQLIADVWCFGYLATGRKYGVSDNAVRKWIRWYERDLAAAEDEKHQAA